MVSKLVVFFPFEIQRPNWLFGGHTTNFTDSWVGAQVRTNMTIGRVMATE
jgi:hypothetical protein